MPLTEEQKKELQEKALKIRKLIIESLAEAGSGHLAGSLGMTDIFAAFYFGGILNHDPKNPSWPERDRLILSNGHICPARYAAMALAGYFPVEELKTLRKFGSRLQGHPEASRLPGLETTSGPLGLGLGQSCGIAYGLKIDSKNNYVFCLMSDAEQQEGNTWESAMFAGKNKLSNLIAVVDFNNIQITGNVSEIMPVEPLRAKYEAFGWNVLEINGHDFEQIINSVETAKKSVGKPTLIIAKTIAGKGVSEIEGDYHWHGKAPTKEEAERFLQQLK